MWDATKAILRGRHVALHICIRKEEKYKINYLRFDVVSPEKEKEIKPKVNTRKEMIKLTVEIKGNSTDKS